MFIMFLLSAGSSAGAMLSVYIAALHMVDSSHRLRMDRLKKKPNDGGFFAKAGGLIARAWRGCCCCFYLRERRAAAAAPRGGSEGVRAPLLTAARS